MPRIFQQIVSLPAGGDPFTYNGNPEDSYDWFSAVKVGGFSLQISFDGGATMPLYKSTKIGWPNFVSFQITNSGTIDAAVSFVIGTDDCSYDHEHEMPVINQLLPRADVVCPNAAATLVVPASLNNYGATISNPATTTGALRWGNSSVLSNRGALLQNGQNQRVAGGCEIWVYNNTGAAVTVSSTTEA